MRAVLQLENASKETHMVIFRFNQGQKLSLKKVLRSWPRLERRNLEVALPKCTHSTQEVGTQKPVTMEGQNNREEKLRTPKTRSRCTIYELNKMCWGPAGRRASMLYFPSAWPLNTRPVPPDPKRKKWQYVPVLKYKLAGPDLPRNDDIRLTQLCARQEAWEEIKMVIICRQYHCLRKSKTELKTYYSE